MILVGNARGGGADLAHHLQKEENDHVEVYELRGFVSDTLPGAFNEVYAQSRGTKCRQYLYSLSLNPPEKEQVETPVFLAAIERIEKKLGLSDQPRAIVFHEKEGRRHAHAVWSRIDTAQMKAVQLSYDHTKLTGISRELFLEHGWQMPPGLARASERDPLNFTLSEYQQAKRTGQNARDIKAAIQDAWAISDNKASFVHALEDRGFKLARGDKGRFVAVDHHGEVYSVPRQTGVKAKAVRERLGSENELPSVNEVQATYAAEMSKTMDRHKADLKKTGHIEVAEMREDRQRLIEQQRQERQKLVRAQKTRQHQEALQRQSRFRKGLSGLWDRLRGEHKRICENNETEALEALRRDRKEKDELIFNQLNQRRMLKLRLSKFKTRYISQRRELAADKAKFEESKTRSLRALRDEAMNVFTRKKPRQRFSSRKSISGPEPER